MARSKGGGSGGKKGDHFGLEARGPTDGIHVGMIRQEQGLFCRLE